MSNDELTPGGQQAEGATTTEEPRNEGAETDKPVTAAEETAAAPGQAPEPATPTEEPSAPEPEPTPAAESEPAPEPTPAEESAPAQPAPGEPAAEKTASVRTADDSDLFEAAMASMSEQEETGESSVGQLRKGERIEAEVIEVRHDRIFVNLGTKAEGELPLDEFSSTPHQSAVGLVQPGDKFEVVVIKPGGGERPAVVSKRKADFDLRWREIVEDFESGKTFNALVIDRVKGGLEVDIGVRGFVPASHVGMGRVRNLEKYVGESLAVKIIELEKDRKKVVLSNKAAAEEEREAAKDELFEKIKPQDVVTGVVRRLTDYGAFVDIGGVDGLLHISEMSWVRIEHPKEVVKEGDEIKVMVLRLDEDRGRISLGLRQVLPDPWKEIRSNYRAGQKLTVTIGRLVQSGAFIKLPEGAEAFLPVGEISEERIKKPSDKLEAGQEVEATIIDLRPDERRMVLSLRDGASPRRGGHPDDLARFRKRVRRRRGGELSDMESSGQGRTAPSGGATIGERLGLLKGILKSEAGAAAVEEPAPAKTPEKKETKARKAAPQKEEKPEPEAPTPEEPKPEEPKAEESKSEDAPKPEEPKAGEPKEQEAAKEEAKAEEPKPEEPETEAKSDGDASESK